MGLIVEEEEYERLTPYVTAMIIIINIVVFIIEIVNYEIIEDYAFVPILFLSGKKLETLITHMFLHGGVLHIFWNMYFAYVFCDDLESVYGHTNFLLFYIICGIGAATIHAILCVALDNIFHTGLSYIPCIGASGALFGVLAAYAVFFPHRKLRIRYAGGYYTVAAWNFAILYGISETILVVVGAFDYVAHTAHVGGFVTGMLAAYVYKYLANVGVDIRYIKRE